MDPASALSRGQLRTGWQDWKRVNSRFRIQDLEMFNVGAEVFLLSASHDRLARVAENIDRGGFQLLSTSPWGPQMARPL